MKRTGHSLSQGNGQKKRQRGAGRGQHGAPKLGHRNETRAWRRAMLKTPRPNTDIII